MAVADELHNLRTGSTPESKFFQTVFRQKEKHPGHQGVFLATPSGRLLASSTCYESEKVIALLNEGWNAWTDLSTAQRLQPKSELVEQTVAGRPEDKYPDDGLVLRVTSRELPPVNLDDDRNRRWHRYYLWFNRDEVQSMLPGRWKKGEQTELPNKLSTRIAALALLDKGRVDGFTRAFRDRDVETAKIELTVLSLNKSIVSFQIKGHTSTKTRDAQAFVSNMPRYENIPKHRGVRAKILGSATFDRGKERFTQFKMVAVGKRFGGAYVGRSPDDWGEHPIGFSFVMGRPTPAEQLAPEFPERYPWLSQRTGNSRFADSGSGLDGQNDQGPQVGQVAPDFDTQRLNGNKEGEKRLKFSSLLGDRPVVLAFGSYT